MFRGLRSTAYIELTILILLSVPLSCPAADGQRRFTVRDSIEMSHFGTIIDSQPDELDDDGVLSPDGRHLVKLTHRGVLPGGQTEGTIWLWDAESIRQAVLDSRRAVPSPMPLARVSSATNGLDFVAERDNVISLLKWADDSRSLYFLARDGGDSRQLFRVDIASRKVTPLTPRNQNVVDFALSSSAIAYLENDAVAPDDQWRSTGSGIPDVITGTGSSFLDLLYPHAAADQFHDPVELGVWAIRDSTATPVTDTQTHRPLKIVTKYIDEALSLSPDGRSAATVTVETPPEAVGKRSVNAPVVTLHYRRFDLEKGLQTPIDVPVVESEENRFRATWSPTGQWIALTNVASVTEPHEKVSSSSACDVAVASVNDHAMQCISFPKEKTTGFVYSINWRQNGAELSVRFRQHTANVYTDKVVRYVRGRWLPNRGWNKPVGLPMTLTVREAVNEPPVLLASDSYTGKQRVIFDPNPQLAGIALGTVVPYQWKDSYGRTIKGGLVKPPNWTASRRYPLVLQTHGFDAQQFYRVGYSETSNAGRALAGRDIIVLQVSEPHNRFARSWQDPMENGTKVYLAAIDQLAAEGLIDPTKVGITGYSRSGHRASAAITFAPDRFAAAFLSNTDPGSLSDYFTYVDYFSPDVVDLTAQIMAGAKPYGPGLQKWVERAPGFSTDRIKAPVLISAANPFHLINLWALYASLRDQGKPVDLQYIRSGEHNIAKPLHKLAHQEILVDWFDYWLNGHEDVNPDKVVQYERWRHLRETRH